jgi:membrane fusion protein (multidrug efflux system)
MNGSFFGSGALMRAQRNLAFIFMLGALALTGCGSGNQKFAPPPQAVGVVNIHTQKVMLTSELPGRTVPYAISDVRPQVSGIILKRLFVEGSEVKAGQVLYEIDPKPYQAAYDNAKAALASAVANAVTKVAEAKRYASLLKVNAISIQSYDDAKAAADQAKAAIEQAKANLETARINLGYTKVTAPISGRIGISTVTAGALVTADQSTALTTIQTLDPIYVDIPQSSAQLLQLEQAVSQGQLMPAQKMSANVDLVLPDGTRYAQKGKLQFADVTVDPNTGSVILRAIFPNPNRVLLPGMFVEAKVAEGVDPHAILAPQQGVAHDPKGQATALVVGKGNKVEMRILTVGRAIGNEWLVHSGLKPGDRLIVQGLQKVKPGQVVNPETVTLPPYQPQYISAGGASTKIGRQ